MTIPAGPTTPFVALKRDLLVRQLRAWAPAALQRSRRITYAHGYADADDALAAEAAARALAEQPGLGRGREITMVAVAADPAATARRLAAVQRESPAAAALVVHTVPGGTDDRLGVALTAVGVRNAPLFGFLDASAAAAPPAFGTVVALAAGRPAEVLLVLPAVVLAGLAEAADGPAAGADGDRLLGAGRWGSVSTAPPRQRRGLLVLQYRSALRAAGFPLVCAVEAVGDDDAGGEVLIFATTSGRSLETYKEALWAAARPAGVRYRDPAHRESPVDVAAAPDPGPLRRALTARLATASATVTDLRTATLTETVYRGADATRVVTDLLAEGVLVRRPEHGRLGGDVVIALAGPAGSDG